MRDYLQEGDLISVSFLHLQTGRRSLGGTWVHHQTPAVQQNYCGGTLPKGSPVHYCPGQVDQGGGREVLH